MGYVYMTNYHFSSSRIAREALSGTAGMTVKPVIFTSSGKDSIFRIMRRVYKFLDDWKASRSDTPVLLSVDPETAKIVNSYFYEMSDSEYEKFSIGDGEVRRYSI